MDRATENIELEIDRGRELLRANLEELEARVARVHQHLEVSARLLRAHEEAGVERVFLFPAHTVAGAYDMPEAEVQAVRRVIRPRVGG